MVADPGLRFENLVACALRKWVDWQTDVEGREYELRYFRDIDRREVDFVVTERRKPILFLESKLSDAAPNPGLRYLAQRFPTVPAWQIAAHGTRDVRNAEGVRLAPAVTFLAKLV